MHELPEERASSASGMRGVEVSPKQLCFFFYLTQNADRQVLPAASETEDPMHAWRIGALIV